MLGQIRLLRETLLAVFNLTDKRSFSSVHAQVIKKVVPFTKNHVAIVMVASQYLHLSHSAWVLKAVDPKLSGVRYSVLNS